MWCTSLVKGAQWPKQPKILCRSLSCWSKLRSSPTLQSKTTEEEKKINNLVSTTSQCRRHVDKLSSLFDLDLFTNLRSFIKHRRSENSPSTMHNSPGQFNEVWLFFILMNQTWIHYVTVKRNYSQKCKILTLSHLLYIPK